MFGKKGQASFIAYAVLVSIIVISGFIGVQKITSIKKEGKDYTKINTAKNILTEIDAIVSELVFESSGAKRKITLNIPEGLSIVGDKDEIRLKVVTEKEIIKPGTRSKEGPLTIQAGPYVAAAKTDYDSDGHDELILENDHVYFVVKSIEETTPLDDINTTNIIELIKNKDLAVNITPDARITIGGKSDSAWGKGYTRLIDTGIEKGILIHVESDANIDYDAVFTLGPVADYLELEVKNIEVK